jgi:hypothetical protein
MLAKFLCVIFCLLFLGCGGASYHAKETRMANDANRLTVGTVQREISKGMSGAGVIEALGSPNIISTDEQGREVWVYDKISTERVQSKSSSGTWLLLFSGSSASGASSVSQRTLTIVVKFDVQGKVRDLAYHTTRF